MKIRTLWDRLQMNKKHPRFRLQFNYKDHSDRLEVNDKNPRDSLEMNYI